MGYIMRLYHVLGAENGQLVAGVTVNVVANVAIIIAVVVANIAIIVGSLAAISPTTIVATVVAAVVVSVPVVVTTVTSGTKSNYLVGCGERLASHHCAGLLRYNLALKLIWAQKRGGNRAHRNGIGS